MEKLVLNSPAKINFGLNIIKKREDGFHDLKTFFYPIYDLCDKITFEKSDHFIFESNNADLVKDPNNLIQEAHSQLENLIKKKIKVKIHLEKNIPIGAGLGGGSSNAASALLGLNEMFELNLKEEKLLETALSLGSDVPFFIKSKPAVGTSRGEILQYSEIYIDKPILIINPGIHISTKDAFSNIKPKKSEFNYKYFLQNKNIDFEYLKENLKNDFEHYVFSIYPEIKGIKDNLYKHNALFTLMSGTGSTIFGIFDDLKSAQIAKNNFVIGHFKFISNY